MKKLTKRIYNLLDNTSLDCLSVSLLLDELEDGVDDMLLDLLKQVELPTDQVQLEKSAITSTIRYS